MVITRAITDQQRGLGLGCGLASLARVSHWVSEVSGGARVGVSYSIYKLKNYSEVSTAYIREVEHEAMSGMAGEPRTVQK